MDIKLLQDIQSEVGIISTLVYSPKLIFFSEDLQPRHFYDESNACLYYAIKELVYNGVETIDAYNLSNLISTNEGVEKRIKKMSIQDLNEFLDLSRLTARNTLEEYRILVKKVQNLSLRRDMIKQLDQAKNVCFNITSTDDVQNKVYELIEDVNKKYAMTKNITVFADKIDILWKEVEDRQDGKILTIPFHIKALNDFVEMEAGELVLFGAHAKIGKSSMLLSSTVDLLRRGMTVLVIDSELSDRLYMLRLIAHISTVPFKIVKDGTGTDEQKALIKDARDWLKTRRLYHEYCPVFNDVEIMTLFKRINCLDKISVLVIDYFKISSLGDAFTVSTTLANTVDVVKNSIAGVYNIPVLGAVQTDVNGKVALSAGIVRHASTLVVIARKTAIELAAESVDCGNSKMTVVFNRNGKQHSDGEYLDIQFDGDILSYTEAKKQHKVIEPF
ncbi:MAG: DnaB-like helicase C-terminal domain-containing protein [bacterium]